MRHLHLYFLYSFLCCLKRLLVVLESSSLSSKIIQVLLEMSEIQDIVVPGTSPEKAIPIPTLAPSPPHLPSVQTLQSWLSLYLNKTDRTVDQLSEILSTPAGTDTLLLTLCYTSLLSSSVLSSISLHRLRKVVRQLIEKAVSLPPNTTLLIDTSDIRLPDICTALGFDWNLEVGKEDLQQSTGKYADKKNNTSSNFCQHTVPIP
jgi:hypothetical protein